MPVSYLSLEAMAAWVVSDPEHNRPSKGWWDWATSAYVLAAQQVAEADAPVCRKCGGPMANGRCLNLAHVGGQGAA